MPSSSLFARAGRRLYTSGSVVAHAAGRRLYTSGSVSRTRQQHAAGSHLHRIEGYSLVSKNTRTGESVMSMDFPVGRGLEWRLSFYPNGIDAENRGFVSARLSLASGGFSFRDTTETYRVSILDRAGKPAHSATVGPCRYGGYESYDFSSWRDGEAELPGKKVIERLVSTEELRRSMPFLSGNDCLDVRCDVDVVDTYVDVEDMDMNVKRRKNWFMGLGRLFGGSSD